MNLFSIKLFLIYKEKVSQNILRHFFYLSFLVKVILQLPLVIFLEAQLDFEQPPQLQPPLADFFMFLYIMKIENATIKAAIII